MIILQSDTPSLVNLDVLVRRRTVLGSLLCLAVVMVPAGPVEAQAVRGRVFDAANDQPLANALIRLVDGAGDGRAATTADSTGRYQLTIAEPGAYRLRAEQLGYETFESRVFEVGLATDTVTIDLTLRPSPIPIRGVEVSTDQMNRRLRDFLGMSPAQLRIRPIRPTAIRDHITRGNSLSEMIRWQNIPNLQVLPTREGACYQFRGSGCMPVYLDGARLTRAPNSMLPLEMLSTVVVLLPSESVAYPSGAVHLFTIGYMR